MSNKIEYGRKHKRVKQSLLEKQKQIEEEQTPKVGKEKWFYGDSKKD